METPAPSACGWILSPAVLFEVVEQLTINIKPSNHGSNNRPKMRMKLSPSIFFPLLLH
jgi:hypothetical protein